MNDSHLTDRLLAAYRHGVSLLWHHSRIISYAAVGLAAPPLISHVVISYRGFLALGPGGLPYNFIGWLIQAFAQPFARHDTRDPRPLADARAAHHYAPHGKTNFLSDIPERCGNRPNVPTYVAPQRQMTDHAVAFRIEAMQLYLGEVASQQPERVIVSQSRLESPEYNALWIHKGIEQPKYLAKSTKGEIVHVHPDGSSHMILSLADAELVTAKGWAERHMLSGVFGVLPLTYVLIYAPRDDEELGIWKRFLEASVAFTTAEKAT